MSSASSRRARSVFAAGGAFRNLGDVQFAHDAGDQPEAHEPEPVVVFDVAAAFVGGNAARDSHAPGDGQTPGHGNPDAQCEVSGAGPAGDCFREGASFLSGQLELLQTGWRPLE